MYEEYLEQAIRVGATGYMMKDAKREELVSAIRDAAKGQFIFGSSLLRSPDRMSAAFAQLQSQWSEEKLSAPQSGLDSQASGNAQVNTTAKEDATVEQTTREDEAELAVKLPAEAPDPVIKDVELIISPPAEPWMLLRLHRWLTDVANIDVGEMAGSWTGDTVVRGSIRRPIPFVKMLAEWPAVAEVTEEPYVEDRETLTMGLKNPMNMLKIGVGRTLPKRFRLTLNSE